MMYYLKLKYAELKCRFCKLAFCCRTCRCKHEKCAHAIPEPECDICVYGVTLISRAHRSPALTAHVGAVHLPLYCQRCERVFTMVEELSDHKCQAMVTKTPKRHGDVANEEEEENFLSPNPNNMLLLNVTKSTLLASTPMYADANKAMDMLEHITPVDAQQIVPNEQESSNKRRVTFGSTPAMAVEHVRRKPKKPEDFLKTSLKNSLRLNDSHPLSSPSLYPSLESTGKSDSFVTAVGEQSTKKRRSYSMNETLWQTALNDTFASGVDEAVGTSAEDDNINAEPKQSYHLSLDLDTDVFDASTECAPATAKAGIWSSMASLWSNVFSYQQLPTPVIAEEDRQDGQQQQNKRLRSTSSDLDGGEQAAARKWKRMKLCDVRGRPPIRHPSRLVVRADMATQTDYTDEYSNYL